MKRVKMLKSAAGPLGAFHVQGVYDVPDNFAQQLIDAGAAELTDDQPSYKDDDGNTLPKISGDVAPEKVVKAKRDREKKQKNEEEAVEVEEAERQEEDELLEWPKKISPEKYLSRWPDGEHSDLARTLTKE